MTDREASMETHAAEHAVKLATEARLAGLLRNASDSDELSNEDWEVVTNVFEMDPECDNCGKPWSEHDRQHEGLSDYRDCPGDESTEFEVSDLSDLADEAEQHITGHCYGADTRVVVNVTNYGGGPAGGVEFTCDKGEHGLELISARTWHNDWFQSKGYCGLDDDTAQTLFDIWGLEYTEGQN